MGLDSVLVMLRREQPRICRHPRKGKGPIARRNRPRRHAYFTTCIALVRCTAHTPILPLSIASCACATSLCAMILPWPSAMVSITDSVFDRFSPLQPAIFAADAGTTVHTTAAIAAAPTTLLSMLHSPFRFRTDQHHCRICEND